VHRELARLQGTVNPLDELGRRMARRFKLLCFDEFHVADITDAMILHRLLAALFDNGVGFVTTSNFEPDGLYSDGLHRDRILPAIALLHERMEIVNVDHGIDYRRGTLEQVHAYLTPLGPQADAALRDAFERLAPCADEDPRLTIEARQVRALRRAGRVAWFDFKTLCDGPRSQNDYLEIAARFHTVLLSGVPQMSARNASAARRFTLLVDVLYDRHVKLILSAAAAPEQLYRQGPLAHEFPRTVSRLSEMQSAQYLALEHRTVDTHLT
jgi:cell division protein ZapE